MKIILYGLGMGLDLIENNLKKEHTILGYTDSYAAITIFRGKPFYELKKLKYIKFDYIIISVYERKVAFKIYSDLIEKYEITEDTIIPFFVYAKYELYDVKLKNCNLNNIKGLIFGNSHAQCGFLERELEVPFINLALSRQDIYYNYKIFQKCIEKWKEKLKNIEYIIIDMYDYCYFNLDSSMTENAIEYILSGGYLDEHNFKNNTNFKKSFKEELSDRAYIPEKSTYIELLFDNRNIVNYNFLNTNARFHHIEKKVMLSQGPILGSIVSKRNQKTIEENIQLLNCFLQEIREFNMNTNIIFTLIPRYIAMEYVCMPFVASWKDEFNEIIEMFCKKYNALFLNYKTYKEFSENPMFYYDIEHMNTVGARALTSLLNNGLKNIKI